MHSELDMRINLASPNNFLQTDKNILSCLLLSQKSRQYIFAAEEKRYVFQASERGMFSVDLR